MDAHDPYASLTTAAPRARLGRILILDRYIASEFLRAFLAILGICAVIILLYTLFETFEDIFQAEHKPGLRVILLYFLFSLPGEVLENAPVLSLLAVLFSIGIMAKNNEILAMHACGVSYTRLGMPVFVCAGALTVIVFLSNEWARPPLARKARAYEAIIQNKEIEESRSDIFKPEFQDRVVFAEFYDGLRRVMAYPRVFELAPGGGWPMRKINARHAQFLGPDPSGEYDEWRFEEVAIWTYDPDTGRIAGEPFASASEVLLMPRNMDRLLARRKKPSEMNAWELAELISILKSGGEVTRAHSTDLQRKIAFPISCLILTLIGYTISVRAHVRPMVAGFGYGLAAGIAYYLLDALARNLGHNGLAPPQLAGWLPNLVFLAVVAYRIRYINQVRA